MANIGHQSRIFFPFESYDCCEKKNLTASKFLQSQNRTKLRQTCLSVRAITGEKKEFERKKF